MNWTWAIAVPNGSYLVHAVSGDALDFAATYSVTAEGTSLYNAAPINGIRWVEGRATVNVTDGTLTIANGTGASNNRLDFVDAIPPR